MVSEGATHLHQDQGKARVGGLNRSDQTAVKVRVLIMMVLLKE